MSDSGAGLLGEDENPRDYAERCMSLVETMLKGEEFQDPKLRAFTMILVQLFGTLQGETRDVFNVTVTSSEAVQALVESVEKLVVAVERQATDIQVLIGAIDKNLSEASTRKGGLFS